MNISTNKKELKLSLNNDELLENFVSTLFDETGRFIEGKSLTVKREDLTTFGVIKGLDDFKIRFESDKIKGLMDVRITTKGNEIEMTTDNMFVIKTNKGKYSFY